MNDKFEKPNLIKYNKSKRWWKEKPNKNRKINHETVIALHKIGYKTDKIGKVLGCCGQYIRRILKINGIKK